MVATVPFHLADVLESEQYSHAAVQPAKLIGLLINYNNDHQLM